MRLRLYPRLHLPAAIPLASLLAAVLLAGPARAAVPPLPDDLSPKEWKPPKELRQIFDDFDAVEGFEELRAFADRVQPVLEKHPDWVDLHRFAIGLARQLDEMPEARAKYEAWVERDSTNAAAQYLLGILEGPGGEKRLRKALELDPQSYYARCGLGLLLLGGNDPRPDEAFPLLFEAARMRPDHPYAYHAIALGYEMSRDWETGLRVRRMAEVVEPSSFQPVQYEMKDLQQLKRGDEVLGRLEAFVEEHPKDRHAQRALVQTYLELNRVGDAIRVQTGLAEQATDYPDETYRAALLLARAGRRDEALDWLKRSARQGFDNYRVAEEDGGLDSLRALAGYAEAIAAMKEQHEKRAPEYRSQVLAKRVDEAAPPFEVTTLDGKTLRLDDLKGKVVVLDFWATWCGPCQKTLPLVQQIQNSVEGKPVEILCMNVWEKDKERAKVAPYWKEKGYTMSVGLASADDATRYAVRGVPTLFVLDRDGKIRFRHSGYTPFMDEEISWVIDSLLAETTEGDGTGSSQGELVR